MTSTDLPAPGCGEALGAGSPTFEVTVFGTPAPQGTKRHVGRGIMVESSAKVKPWREAVKHAVLADWAHPHWFEGPLDVVIAFTVAKPSSAPKTRRTWPCKRPDLDKLVRSTFDALSDVGVWRDDAQVVHLVTAKLYPGEGPNALPVPGALISIRGAA